MDQNKLTAEEFKILEEDFGGEDKVIRTLRTAHDLKYKEAVFQEENKKRGRRSGHVNKDFQESVLKHPANGSRHHIALQAFIKLLNIYKIGHPLSKKYRSGKRFDYGFDYFLSAARKGHKISAKSRKGVSVTWLANRSSVSEKGIKLIENGTSTPNETTWEKLRVALPELPSFSSITTFKI